VFTTTIKQTTLHATRQFRILSSNTYCFVKVASSSPLLLPKHQQMISHTHKRNRHRFVTFHRKRRYRTIRKLESKTHNTWRTLQTARTSS